MEEKQHKQSPPKYGSPTPLQSAAFLFGVTGLGAVGGFLMMFSKARSKANDAFHGNNLSKTPNVEFENGARLAMRALGRATVYSVGGFTLFWLAVCQLMDIHNLKEFTAKMQSIMPRIPPGKHSTGEKVDWDELFGLKEKKTIESSDAES